MAARIGSFILGALLSTAAVAADLSVELTVDRAQASLGDEITAQVTVRGAQRSGDPVVEGLAAFDGQKAGTASQVQIINGNTSLSVVFTYALTAKTVGTFTLGPARVTVAGQTAASQPVTLTVVKGAVAKPDSRPFQLTAQVDPPQGYVGQQFIYTFQFLSRGQLLNAQLSLPDFNGFWKEELGKQRNFEVLRNGQRWMVTEIRLALFPTRPGDLSIGPAALAGDARVEAPRGDSPLDEFFDGGFFGFGGRMKRIQLRSLGLVVKVQSLPAAGRPAGFSGVVGQVSVRSLLSKDRLAVGDSATWTVEISGVGNVKDARVEAPRLAGFKVYDDQPSFQGALQGTRLGGTKVFKKALVPLEAGAREIPAVEIPYFDPEHGGYRVARGEPLRLEVTPGTGNPAVAMGLSREAVAVRGEDVIAPRWSVTPRSEGLRPPLKWACLFLWLLGPGIFLGSRIGADQWRRRRGDTARLRRERAWRVWRREAAAWNGSASFENVSRALRQYLGDRFNTDGGALTPLDVREKLGVRGVPEAILAEAENLLDLCERGRYGGGGDSAGVRSRAESLVRRLEKEGPP